MPERFFVAALLRMTSKDKAPRAARKLREHILGYNPLRKADPSPKTGS